MIFSTNHKDIITSAYILLIGAILFFSQRDYRVIRVISYGLTLTQDNPVLEEVVTKDSSWYPCIFSGLIAGVTVVVCATAVVGGLIYFGVIPFPSSVPVPQVQYNDQTLYRMLATLDNLSGQNDLSHFNAWVANKAPAHVDYLQFLLLQEAIQENTDLVASLIDLTT